MPKPNPDTPTEALSDYPEKVDDSRLVGVDATGIPVYYDEANERAFEALQSEGSWVVGDERESGELANIIEHIGQVTGWEALAEFAPGHDEDEDSEN